MHIAGRLATIDKVIAPFRKAGFAVRVPWMVNKYPDPVGGSWEDTMYQDCLHRVRGKAEFLANPHLDEFFFPRGKFSTLTEVLLHAKKRYPGASEYKLYEHPLLKDMKSPMEVHVMLDQSPCKIDTHGITPAKRVRRQSR